jgi:hypothetical protein
MQFSRNLVSATIRPDSRAVGRAANSIVHRTKSVRAIFSGSEKGGPLRRSVFRRRREIGVTSVSIGGRSSSGIAPRGASCRER